MYGHTFVGVAGD
jgi:hypothetical protein